MPKISYSLVFGGPDGELLTTHCDIMHDVKNTNK